MLSALVLAGCQAPEARQAAEPSPTALPSPTGELGEAVLLGERIVQETGIHAKAYVGNKLSCTSCHIDAGRKDNAAPFTGVYASYPQYRARSGEVTTLEDRVNECFQRSMNGKPLPRDSREMKALIAYMAWASTGVPVGTSPEGLGIDKIKAERKPDAEKGKAAYATSCAACHGVDGQGVGPFPPLWGDQSFNIGAGMARLNTAAAFIKWNMPKGREGTLSNEEAYDIAAYVLSHPRPDFADKAKDWPKGGKPADTPY
jgi:thiosulfate dehydrogenase